MHNIRFPNQTILKCDTWQERVRVCVNDVDVIGVGLVESDDRIGFFEVRIGRIQTRYSTQYHSEIAAQCLPGVTGIKIDKVFFILTD